MASTLDRQYISYDSQELNIFRRKEQVKNEVKKKFGFFTLLTHENS